MLSNSYPASFSPLVTPSTTFVSSQVPSADDFTNVVISPKNIIGQVEGPRTLRARLVANRRYSKPSRRRFSSSPTSLSSSPPPYDYWAIPTHPDAQEWYAADLAEKQGLEAVHFATLVPRSEVPSHVTVKGTRRVYERKPSGLAKARLVVKDFRNPEVETPFSPVAADDSFKTLCTIAAAENLDLHQLDVVRAFTLPPLDAKVEEYIEIPRGYATDSSLIKTHVFRLNKSLYGLRIAALYFANFIKQILLSLVLDDSRFIQSTADPCLFHYKNSTGEVLHVLTHVDDFMVAATENSSIFNDFLTLFSLDLPLKYLGNPTKYLSYQMYRDRAHRTIVLHQQVHTLGLLEAANLSSDFPSKSKGDLFSRPLPLDSILLPEDTTFLYREIVGGLQHLASHARPDIAYESATLARFSHSFGSLHVQACKQLLKYLAYTSHYGLHLGGESDSLSLIGYADAGTILDPSGRGIVGYIFKLGTSTISFKSKWLKSVHPSTTELEYVALFYASSKAIWLRKLLTGFGFGLDDATLIHEDNDGCVKYAHSIDRSGRMQHINVKFHFIREKVDSNEINVQKISTVDNLADGFTKSIGGSKLQSSLTNWGIFPIVSD